MSVTRLPCDNCAHAVVCALRPALVETVRAVEYATTPPSMLADAIRITASVEVSCSLHATSGPAARVTARQQQYFDALRTYDGNMSAASRYLGQVSSSGIQTTIARLRKRGALPPDIEALVSRRAYGPRTR